MYRRQYIDAFLLCFYLADNTNMNKIKTILDKEMTKRGLSANKLSELTGVPQPTITRIRNGTTADPETNTVKALAEFFDLTVPQMRGEVDNQYSEKRQTTELKVEQKKEFFYSNSSKFMTVLEVKELLNQLSPEAKEIVIDLAGKLARLESMKQ